MDYELNVADYTDNSAHAYNDPACDFGELLNNLWSDVRIDYWAVAFKIIIPAGTYTASTPIKWFGSYNRGGRFHCFADDVTINWNGGNTTCLTCGGNPDDPRTHGDTISIAPAQVDYSTITGITFTNISSGIRSKTCVALRIYNANHWSLENLNFNNFGTASIVWAVADPYYQQQGYSYFNAFRNCHVHDCEIGFWQAGEPQGYNLKNGSATVQTVGIRTATTLTASPWTLGIDGSGDALPTSGQVEISYQTYAVAPAGMYRTVCTIDESRQLTYVSGDALVAGSRNIRWIIDDNIAAVVSNVPPSHPLSYAQFNRLNGGTQGDNLPDQNTPVTLTWTTAVRRSIELIGNTISGGVGDTLPSGQQIKIIWWGIRDTGGGVLQQYLFETTPTITDGVLDSVPTDAWPINATWTGSFTRTNCYIIPDYNGALCVVGGTGDCIDLAYGGYYLTWNGAGSPPRAVNIYWEGGSLLSTCTVELVYYRGWQFNLSATGMASGTYTKFDVIQEASLTVPISNDGIVTLPTDNVNIYQFYLLNSFVENDFYNVNVTWDGGSRTGCTFDQVLIEARLAGGSGDALPTNGTVTITQFRGIRNYRIGINAYSMTDTLVTYNNGHACQSHAMKYYQIKGTGTIDTLFDLRMGSDNHLLGVDFQPDNSGSYLIKGSRGANITIDYLNDTPMNVLWSLTAGEQENGNIWKAYGDGIGNNIYSKASLDNVTITDQAALL